MGLLPRSREDHFLAEQMGSGYSPAIMKTLTAILCGFALLGMIMNANAAERLRHVVCFKFKDTAAAQDIKRAEVAFQALKKKIPQVVALEWGTNISKERRDKGFTHCFVLTFKSEKDRDAYINHPEHKAFAGSVGPVVDDVFVIDFWAKD
jgi:hypothetical protein